MIQVMIVEDDPMVREINRKFVHQITGFQVCALAGSLAEARELAGKWKPELILLDLYLPHGNGLDFLKWLRKEELETDVILITADKNAETVEEALRYGAIDYLIKPFTFVRLQEALQQYRLRKKSLGQGAEMEQQTLDQYIFTTKREEKNPEVQHRLPKGLNDQTYQLLHAAMLNCGEDALTAEELAERVGLSRVTVRRYLEFMVQEGQAIVRLEYGKVGRPQHYYKLKK